MPPQKRMQFIDAADRRDIHRLSHLTIASGFYIATPGIWGRGGGWALWRDGRRILRLCKFANDQERSGAVAGDFFRTPAEKAGFQAPFLGHADDDQIVIARVVKNDADGGAVFDDLEGNGSAVPAGCVKAFSTARLASADLGGGGDHRGDDVQDGGLALVLWDMLRGQVECQGIVGAAQIGDEDAVDISQAAIDEDGDVGGQAVSTRWTAPPSMALPKMGL